MVCILLTYLCTSALVLGRSYYSRVLQNRFPICCMIGLKLSLLTGDQRFPTTGADSLFLIGVGGGGGVSSWESGEGCWGSQEGGDEVVRITLYFYRPQTKFGARYYFQKRVSRILSTGGVPGLGRCLVPGGEGVWSQGVHGPGGDLQTHNQGGS